MKQVQTVSNRSQNIHIRIAPEQRALIDQAARIAGKSLTEFILETATREAENTLLYQRLFLLDEEQWVAFTTALDAPPHADAKLRKLMNAGVPWTER